MIPLLHDNFVEFSVRAPLKFFCGTEWSPDRRQCRWRWTARALNRGQVNRVRCLLRIRPSGNAGRPSPPFRRERSAQPGFSTFASVSSLRPLHMTVSFAEFHPIQLSSTSERSILNHFQMLLFPETLFVYSFFFPVFTALVYGVLVYIGCPV